ncbi:MAG: hypothetical protein HKN19_11735 [Halioglobus sp.]|nr:hypothetical protein [Halioglobus sp.]
MKTFLRENPTVAFGLGLPLLLVVVFLLISGIPALIVDSPKYDVIYATEYYNLQEGVQIAVVGGQVQVTYRGTARADQLQVPRLWRYYAATGAVQEIAITLPPNLPTYASGSEQAADTLIAVPIEVIDLQGLTVDSSSIAPDGYEFSTDDDRYSGNVFGGLFYSSRYRQHAAMTKDGRRVRLPNTDNWRYGHQTRFIGWVVES